MKILGNKLVRTGAFGLLFLLAGNPVADLLDLKYWMPGMGGGRLSVFAYQSTAEPAGVLFLGSSRMRTMILPKRAGELLSRELGREITTFNLAQPQTNALGATIVLRDVVASNGCPETIVYELTPGTMSAATPMTIRVLEDYASLRDLPRMVGLMTDTEAIGAAGRGLVRGHVNLALAVWRPPVAARHRRRIARLVDDRGIRRSRPAERRAPGEAAAEEEEERRILEEQRRQASGEYRIAGAAKRSIAAAIRIAERCDSRLLFVNPPVQSGYRDIYDPREPAFTEYTRALASTSGVSYRDLASAFPGLTEDDFNDPIHFSDPGAEKLTARIVEEVLLD